MRRPNYVEHDIFRTPISWRDFTSEVLYIIDNGSNQYRDDGEAVTVTPPNINPENEFLDAVPWKHTPIFWELNYELDNKSSARSFAQDNTPGDTDGSSAASSHPGTPELDAATLFDGLGKSIKGKSWADMLDDEDDEIFVATAFVPESPTLDQRTHARVVVALPQVPSSEYCSSRVANMSSDKSDDATTEASNTFSQSVLDLKEAGGEVAVPVVALPKVATLEEKDSKDSDDSSIEFYETVSQPAPELSQHGDELMTPPVVALPATTTVEHQGSKNLWTIAEESNNDDSSAEKEPADAPATPGSSDDSEEYTNDGSPTGKDSPHTPNTPGFTDHGDEPVIEIFDGLGTDIRGARWSDMMDDEDMEVHDLFVHAPEPIAKVPKALEEIAQAPEPITKVPKPVKKVPEPVRISTIEIFDGRGLSLKGRPWADADPDESNDLDELARKWGLFETAPETETAAKSKPARKAKRQTKGKGKAKGKKRH